MATIELSEETAAGYLGSNTTTLRWMIDNGHEDIRALERRAQAMEEWLVNPSLMRADAGAEYAEVIEINMSEIKEPLLACANDPDDVKPLSKIAGTKIDEQQLMEEGVSTFYTFSFPVICKDGNHEIVQGLELDEFNVFRLKVSEKELLEERSVIEDRLHRRT